MAQLVEQEFQVQELCCLENGRCGKPWPLENTTSNSLRIKFLHLVRLMGHGVLVLISLPTDFEVWLVVPKKISKLPSVGYNDAVEDVWTLG